MRQVDFDQNSPCGSHESTAAIDCPTKTSETFDHGALDQLEDVLREKLDQGFGALEIVEEMAREKANEIAGKMIMRFMALVAGKAKPRLFIDCLLYRSGAGLRDGMSIISIAREHGVTKQAVQQYIEEHIEKDFPDFPKNRTERSETAKYSMAKSYFKMPQL